MSFQPPSEDPGLALKVSNKGVDMSQSLEGYRPAYGPGSISLIKTYHTLMTLQGGWMPISLSSGPKPNPVLLV